MQELLKNPIGKVIVTTHSYFAQNPSFDKMTREWAVLIVIDEDQIFTPVENVSYTQIDFHTMRSCANSYRSMKSNKMKSLSFIIDNALLMGKIDEEIAIPNLTLKEEHKLWSRGLKNIAPILREIQAKKILGFDRAFHISKAIPVNQNPVLVGAVTVDYDLVSKRLDTNSVNEIAVDSLPLPEGTVIKRISTSRTSMNCLHGDNLNRICFIYANLIKRNAELGKTGIIIVKKKIATEVITTINSMLAEIGSDARTALHSEVDIITPNLIPVLTYGIKGVNTYSNCDYVYCLSSFYTTAEIIRLHLSFYYDFKYAAAVQILNDDGERTIATNINAEDRRLAAKLLDMYETAVVIQAIGRIRPFTLENKEVIVVQRNRTYKGETVYFSLESFCSDHEIPTRTGLRKKLRKIEVCKLNDDGVSAQEIATRLNISKQTVYNYIGAKNEVA